MKDIVFLGIKHCGKSTQGRLLAKRLGLNFADSDDLLENTYMQEYACSGSDVCARSIMQKHGEEFFRKFEAGVIRNILKEKTSVKQVLALGGGVPCNLFLTDAELKDLGTLVYLNVEPETAFKRIVSGGIPPFLQGEDPHARFLAMYEKRTPRYRELADVIIDVPGEGRAEDLNEKIYNCLLEKKLLDI